MTKVKDGFYHGSIPNGPDNSYILLGGGGYTPKAENGKILSYSATNGFIWKEDENNNTDEKVKQISNTTTSSYNVLLSSVNTSGNTGYSYYTSYVNIIPSTGTLSTKLLHITNTEAKSHILFNRVGSGTGSNMAPNYIVTPNNGYIAFNTRGLINTVMSVLLIGPNEIFPGKTNSYNLGTSSLKWKNTYSTYFIGWLQGTADNATYSYYSYVSYITDNQFTYIALYKGNSYQPTYIYSDLYYDKTNKILHTNIDGNANTANKWKTSCTLTIGNTGKTVDGSENVSWSLAEIGAADASHNHDDRYWWTNGLGSYIQTSTGIDSTTYSDLNSYTTPGTYYSANSNVTIRLKNVPFSGAGFKLYVERNYANSYFNQYIIPNPSSSFIYTRGAYYVSNTYTWGDWKIIPKLPLPEDGTRKVLTYSSGKFSWSNDNDNNTWRPVKMTQGSTTSTLSTADTLTLKNGTGINLSYANGGTITIGHSNSVTAGTAAGSATATLSFGGTFTIPTISYDAQGHITSWNTRTMTMPNNPVKNGTVGKLVYYDTTTSVKPVTNSYGSATKLLYINSGVLYSSDSTVGSNYEPVFLNAGTITKGLAYAGGTKVTLNGSNKGSSTASFYAPTSAGSANQILRSKGSGEPEWTNEDWAYTWQNTTTTSRRDSKTSWPQNLSENSYVKVYSRQWADTTLTYTDNTNAQKPITDAGIMCVWLEGTSNTNEAHINMTIDGFYHSYRGFKLGSGDNNKVLLDGGGSKNISDFILFSNLNYTTANKNYKVQADDNNNLYVNVPWTDNNTDTKVSQVSCTTNQSYALLFKYNHGTTTTTVTNTVNFNTGITVNPATGTLSTNLLHITNTEVKSHILFNRVGDGTSSNMAPNYIVTPNNGYIAFNTRGLNYTVNSVLLIGPNEIFPGKTNSYNLGTSSLKWKNTYSTYFIGWLQGNADTATKATNIIGGAANKIAYQSADDTTTFIDAPSSNTYLKYDGSKFVWATITDTNTDTKVSQVSCTTNQSYALLFKYNHGTTTTTVTNTVNFNTGITVNPYTKTAYATYFQGWLKGNVTGNADTASKATNIAGGDANKIAYQSATDTTKFIDAPSANTYLKYDGSKFVWATVTDNNTWRNITVNGTAWKGTATNTGAMNVKNGTSITVSSSSSNNDLTISHNTLFSSAKASGFYKISYDTQGHITGSTAVTKADITGLGIPGSDTHYTTHLYIGTKNTNTNGETTNGNTYIKAYDDTTLRNQYKIVGSGSVSVTSDANGHITITGTDNNTDTKVTQTVTTTSANYPILFKNTTSVDTVTDTARFGSKITANPSTGTINAYYLNLTYNGGAGALLTFGRSGSVNYIQSPDENSPFYIRTGDNNAKVSVQISYSGLIPGWKNTKILGTSTYYWHSAYMTYIYGTSFSGNAATATSSKYVELYEARGTTTSLNKAANYVAAGAMFHIVASSSTTTGKTPTDANILQMNWDNNGGYDSQFGISTGANRSWFRSQASAGTTWQEIVHTDASTQVGSLTQGAYINNVGQVKAMTYSLSSNVNTGVASKIAYYTNVNTIKNTTINTDGTYLANVSYISVNANHQTTNRLYINGGNAKINAGALHIFPNASSFSEGIRIHAASNGWTTLALCGTDNTGDSGTSAYTWTLHTNNGNFYINRNTSSGANASRLWGRDTGWTIGNTTASSYSLEIAGVTRINSGILWTNSVVSNSTYRVDYLGDTNHYWRGAFIHGSGDIHWNNLNTTVGNVGGDPGSPVVTTSTARGITRIHSNLSNNFNSPGNKLYGMSPEAITVEYTTNSGSAWTEQTASTSGLSAANFRIYKRRLTNGTWGNQGKLNHVGNVADAASGATCSITVGMGMRITLDFQVEHRLGWIDCLTIYYLTRGHKCQCKVERWNKNTDTWTTIEDVVINNSNQYRTIYPTNAFYMNGNTSTATATYANKLRITMIVTALGTAQRYAPGIYGINGQGHGGVSISRSADYSHGRFSDYIIAQNGIPLNFSTRDNNCMTALGQYWQFWGDGEWRAAGTGNTADLYLGNSQDINTAGEHSEGRLFLYSKSSYAHYIIGSTATASRSHELPDSGGWIVGGPTAGVGSNTKPAYLGSDGVLREVLYNINSSINSGTTNRLTYYSAANALSASLVSFDSSTGNVTMPAASKLIFSETTGSTLNSIEFYYKGGASSTIKWNFDATGGWARTLLAFNVKWEGNTNYSTLANFGGYGSATDFNWFYLGDGGYSDSSAPYNIRIQKTDQNHWQLTSNTGGTSWTNGNKTALITQSRAVGWHPLVSIPTGYGHWNIGNHNTGQYRDDLIFSYIRNQDITANVNVGYNVILRTPKKSQNTYIYDSDHDLMPNATLTYSLGSASNKFLHMYARYFSGALYCGDYSYAYQCIDSGSGNQLSPGMYVYRYSSVKDTEISEFPNGQGANDGLITSWSWGAANNKYGAQLYVGESPGDMLSFRQRSSAGVWSRWETITGKYYLYKNLSGIGWYRVLDCTVYGSSILVSIGESYNNSNPAPCTFIISMGYQSATITQINKACKVPTGITKIRVVRYANGKHYVDVYFAVAAAAGNGEHINFCNLGHNNSITGLTPIDWTSVAEAMASGQTLDAQENLSMYGDSHKDWATFTTGATTANKMILITIKSSLWWMLKFNLHLYNNYISRDISISGYRYNSASNPWYSPKADMYGTSGNPLDVTFGYITDKSGLRWIAFPRGNYQGVCISEYTAGYDQDPKVTPKELFDIQEVDSTYITTSPMIVQTTITAQNHADTAISATSATNVTVTNNYTSNADYPVVWSNVANANSSSANQLYKSFTYLSWNAKNHFLTVNGAKETLKLNSASDYNVIYYTLTNSYAWSVGSNTSNQFYFWNSSGQSTVTYITYAGNLYAKGGFIKGSSSNKHILTGGGGHIAPPSAAARKVLSYANGAISWTDDVNINTWRTVKMTQGSTTSTLSTADTLTLKNGTGISLSYANGGTITIASTVTNTDTLVTQTATTTSSNYPILFKNTTSVDTITDTARFGSGITVNPSTKTITATTFNGTASKATNIAGGAANKIVYQSAANTTSFITAPSTANTNDYTRKKVLTYVHGQGFKWGIGNIPYEYTNANNTYNLLFTLAADNNMVSIGGTNPGAAGINANIYVTPSQGKLSATYFNGWLTGTADNVTVQTSNATSVKNLVFSAGHDTSGTTSRQLLASDNIKVYPGLGKITATYFDGIATSADKSVIEKTTNTSATYYLVGVNTSVNGTFKLYSGAPRFIGNDVYQASDIKLKKNIKEVSNDFVNNIFDSYTNIIKEFDWKTSNMHSTGFIAQELSYIIPTAVNYDSYSYTYSVNYNQALSKLVGALLKKTKEQDKRISYLENILFNKIQ